MLTKSIGNSGFGQNTVGSIHCPVPQTSLSYGSFDSVNSLSVNKSFPPSVSTGHKTPTSCFSREPPRPIAVSSVYFLQLTHKRCNENSIFCNKFDLKDDECTHRFQSTKRRPRFDCMIVFF